MVRMVSLRLIGTVARPRLSSILSAPRASFEMLLAETWFLNMKRLYLLSLTAMQQSLVPLTVVYHAWYVTASARFSNIIAAHYDGGVEPQIGGAAALMQLVEVASGAKPENECTACGSAGCGLILLRASHWW